MKDKRAIEFGKRVRHVRELLKLKQKEFAERIGIEIKGKTPGQKGLI